MKSLLSFLLFFLNILIFSQAKNVYVNEQIGLTVNLPANFKIPEVQRVITKDYKEPENKETTEVTKNQKPITIFKGNGDNSLMFFVKKPKDQRKDLKKYLVDQHKIILDSFKTNEKNIKYEEKTEDEKIDSVNFIKSVLILKKEEYTGYFYVYTAIIKDYETHIIAFVNNDSDGEELLESLKKSKFH